MAVAFYSTLDVTQCTKAGFVVKEQTTTGLGYVIGWYLSRNLLLVPQLSLLTTEAFPKNSLDDELRTYSFGACGRDVLLHITMAVEKELSLSLSIAKPKGKDYVIIEKGNPKEFVEIAQRLFTKLLKRLDITLDEAAQKRIDHISESSLKELVEFSEKAIVKNRLNLDEVAYRKQGPDLASILFLMAVSPGNDLRRMEYYTRRYLKTDPYHPFIATKRASLELIGGKPKQGLDGLKEVFAMSPYYPELYLAASGSQEFSVGDSLKAAKIAIDLMPSNAVPHYNYALLLAKAGETYKTLEHIEKALVTFPKYGPLILLRARTLERLGKKKEAVRQMESYLSIKANERRAPLGHEYYYAALFAQKNGDEEKKREWAAKAQEYPDASGISDDIKKLL